MTKYQPTPITLDAITNDFWERFPDRKGEQLSYDFTEVIGGNAYWSSSPRAPYTFEYHPHRSTAHKRLSIKHMPGD